MINFEKKKMMPLTSKGYGLYLNQATVTFARSGLMINSLLIKIIVKLETIVILQVNTEVLHIVYVI